MQSKLDATVTLTMSYAEANHLATFIEYARQGKTVDPDSPAAHAAYDALRTLTAAQMRTADLRVSRV